jgi:chitinase
MAFAIRNSLASASRGGVIKPGAPTNIIVTWNAIAASTATATVTFTAGTPPGLSYTVSATPSGGSATAPIAAITTGTSVSNLTNNKNYTFTVVAKRGALTNSTTSTSTLSPPGPVTIGTISSVTNSGASVAYTEPTGGGTYAITTTPATQTTTASSNPQAVSGLSGNNNYTFTIKVSNTTGNNSSTSGSYLTVPNQPTIGTVAVTSTTQVSVPFTYTGTGALTSVTVVSNPSITLTATGTTSPVSVTGTFASGTSYTFTIAVRNATGLSVASAASTTAVTPNPAATIKTFTVTEGGNCSLSGVNSVVSAIYTANGSYTGGADVTDKVRSYLSNGSLNFSASNGTFGDPLPGTYKWLYLQYT